MMRKEFEKSLRVSPENYTYGRVDTVCVSQADHIRTDIEKPEPETRLIETSTQEHVVFARRTSERPRNKEQKSDVSPWEPFNLEPNPNQRFINLYGGPFSQQMELNRVNADRLLEVAAIQGRVILTDVPMDRNRVIAGVNADGSVSKKRNLFFGEKLEEDESKTLVKPIPEGWKIEIPGQDILDEISRKKSRRTLGKRFVTEVNSVIRSSIQEILIREKFKVEKHGLEYFMTFLPVVLTLSSLAWEASGDPNFHFNVVPSAAGFLLCWYVPSVVDTLGPPIFRSREEKYELLMPPLEFDRFLRGYIFVNLKGRNLVRLKAPN